MSYVPNIPASTDRPSQSQSQIQTNFTQLNNIFGNDHIKFDAAANNGDHQQVTFPASTVQGAFVDPASVLYTKLIGPQPQLFFKNSLGDTQITGGATVAASPGYVTLPSGIRIAWGTATANVGGTSVSFASAFPNNCWAVTTAANSTTGGIAVTAQGFNQTGFKAYSQFSGTVFSYIAIGN